MPLDPLPHLMGFCQLLHLVLKLLNRANIIYPTAKKMARKKLKIQQFLRGVFGKLKRHSHLKILLAFFLAFAIACGLISLPAFPQLPQNGSNPEALVEQARLLYETGQGLLLLLLSVVSLKMLK